MHVASASTAFQPIRLTSNATAVSERQLDLCGVRLQAAPWSILAKMMEDTQTGPRRSGWVQPLRLGPLRFNLALAGASGRLWAELVETETISWEISPSELLADPVDVIGEGEYATQRGYHTTANLHQGCIASASVVTSSTHARTTIHLLDCSPCRSMG